MADEEGQAVDEPAACQRCGARTWRPIVYGMPGVELAEAAERGDVELGGCSVSSEAPAWRCQACGAAAGEVELSLELDDGGNR